MPVDELIELIALDAIDAVDGETGGDAHDEEDERHLPEREAAACTHGADPGAHVQGMLDVNTAAFRRTPGVAASVNVARTIEFCPGTTTVVTASYP